MGNVFSGDHSRVLHIDCSFPCSNVGGDVNLEVTIQSYYNASLEDGTLSIDDPNGYFFQKVLFVPSIPPLEKVSLNITLVSTSNQSILNIPHYLKLVYRSGNGISKDTRKRLNVNNFINKMVSINNSKKFLVIGLQCSGKSTFINNLIWTLKPQYRGQYFAQTGSTLLATTVELKKYSIEFDYGKIDMIDTWGMNNENYSVDVMNNILDGVYEVGTSILPDNSINRRVPEEEDDVEQIGRPDGVLVFIHHSGAVDEIWITKLFELIKDIQKKEMNYRIVISHVDEIDYNLRVNVFYQSKRLFQIRDRLAQKLGIVNEKMTRIKYFVNIANHLEPEFDKEQNIYDIINDLYSTTRTFEDDPTTIIK